MKYMRIWLGMILGQAISIALGVVDVAEAVTAVYWCGIAIFVCWLERPASSASVAREVK